MPFQEHHPSGGLLSHVNNILLSIVVAFRGGYVLTPGRYRKSPGGATQWDGPGRGRSQHAPAGCAEAQPALPEGASAFCGHLATNKMPV